MSFVLLPLYFSFFFLSYAQAVDSGYRRSGHQGTILNFTLWLDGGHKVWLNDSGSAPFPNLTSINLRQDFSIPGTYYWSSHYKPSNVPDISYGTLWSNEVDTFWLYGGGAFGDNYTNENSLWRYQPNSDQWTRLDNEKANLTSTRPVDGAGCNVPSLATGYYLGGYASTEVPNSNETIEYFNSMVVFDMVGETTTVVEVPNYVPVIGQSLLFLDAGDSGVLAVLGGSTAINGSLSMASLAQVFLYEIASSRWMIQSTTDTLGRSDIFYGAYDVYSPGIPENREHMCAVVGTPADISSYNIYVFGGQNDTDTPGDIWALSLPGAVWIRLFTQDNTNNPKTASSCNLINGRYVLMSDGCWFGGYNMCLSYGWNPLLYDITTADWSWTFDSTVEGYYVPQEISNVIGGTSWGSALHRSPIFTTFADPTLAQIFHPALKLSGGYYHLILKIVLPVLSSIPCLLWLLEKVTEKPSKPMGQQSHTPWALRLPFLTLIISSTAALIVTVAILWQISVQSDTDSGHWSGGPETDGLWSGSTWNTSFVPGVGSGRPPGGLISFYLDTAQEGQWSRKNATQRMGIGNYVLWTYIPSIVAVLYGVLWSIVDGELKRHEAFRQLSQSDGCLGKASLCLDYHSFWSPLSIWQAVRYRQWGVACSSTGFVLALIALPNLQNYVFTWTIYSGGDLAWGGELSWQVAAVDPYWAKALLGVLGVIMGCALGLTVMLHHHPVENAGIAGLTELVLDRSADDLGLQGCFRITGYHPHRVSPLVSLERLLSKLGDCRFIITTNPQHPHHHQLTLVKDKNLTSVSLLRKRWQDLITRCKKPFQWLSAFPSSISRILRACASHLRGDRSRAFLFRPLPLTLWIIALALLLAANTYLLVGMTTNASMQYQNYQLPWPPNAYLIVGVFVQSIYQVLERSVRSTIILNRLSNGYQDPSLLYEDWTTSIPVLEIFQAFQSQNHLLGYVLLGSLFSIVYTIMLGSLQVSASFYGATTFHADLDGTSITFAMNLYLLGVSCAIGWRYCFGWEGGRRRQVLPWPMGTVAALLPFVVESQLLKEDIRKAKCDAIAGTAEARVEVLRGLSRRYGFGTFEIAGGDRVVHLGVERNFIDGVDGKEHVSAWWS